MKILAQMPQSMIVPAGELERRKRLEYELREEPDPARLCFMLTADGASAFCLTPQMAFDVVTAANASLLALEQFSRMLRVPVSELLGMRNLSSLVSAVVVSEFATVCPDLMYINPHQDGYPDLIPRIDAACDYYDNMTAAGRLNDKLAWTDPGFGGVEVKATCGDTPKASEVAKPDLYEERSSLVEKFIWKSHHQSTNRLFAVTWDFVDGIPTVTAGMFRNDLELSDWGKIAKPRSGGGRTTSVSNMKASGRAKMAEGWLVRTKDEQLRGALQRAKLLPMASRRALL